MKENGKIQATVYQVDLNLFDVDEDFSDIAESIVKKINADQDIRHQFNLQRLAKQNFGEYEIRIYHAVKSQPPKWRAFLSEILDKNSIVLKATNTTHSYICFIGFQNKIFAVTGGSGSFALERFVIFNFGLEILVRLFQKDSKVIKAAQNREVTGSILGQSRFFRGDQRFSDNDQFGTVYKMIQAELNQNLLKKILGFSDNELKRNVSGCLAKSSFQINKSVDFPILLRLVGRFIEILKKKRNFSLNKVTLISKRNSNNKELLEELDDYLKEILYQDCLADRVPDFDFCHKEYEKFFTSSSAELIVDNVTIDLDKPISLPDIIYKLRKVGRLELKDIHQYNWFVLQRKIETFDENGESLTKGSVLDHIHGEISYKNQIYFLIDGEWYRIHKDFIRDLNEECKDLFVQSWDGELLTETFDVQKEREYNCKFIGKEGHLVFDTITPDNIESCDVLKYDDKLVHLIHVKKGFNNSIRDLTAQIYIAAKRIKRDIKSGYHYLTEVEEGTKKGKYSPSAYMKKLGSQAFPEGGLKSLFETKHDKSIVFCLAFVDTAVNSRCLKDEVESFESSIAKFSLVELRRQIIGLGFEFKIVQIGR